jgi:hypothetical protein
MGRIAISMKGPEGIVAVLSGWRDDTDCTKNSHSLWCTGEWQGTSIGGVTVGGSIWGMTVGGSKEFRIFEPLIELIDVDIHISVEITFLLPANDISSTPYGCSIFSFSTY